MHNPNFLIIYPDTLAANAVHCYGNPIVKTPNIDRLAETGVRFTNCTSQNPVCCPSRMSLHTGKYVSAHRYYDNGIAYPDGHLTIPQFMKAQGYRTAYFGKTHAIEHSEWDEVFDLYRDYNSYLRSRGIDAHYPEVLPLDQNNHGHSEIPSKDWATNVLGNMGESFIHEQNNAQTPFLLFMSFEAPHSPVTYPRDEPRIYDPADIVLPKVPENALVGKPEARELYMKHRGTVIKSDDALKRALSYYYSMVTMLDKNIGKLVSALEESGQRDNTIVIFLSDHGDFLGNYHCVGKTLSVDQSLVHVPLILNCPAKFQPRAVESLVESIDVFPTLVDLLGAEEPRGLQGRSLIPHALGKAENERSFAFTEEYYATGPYFWGVRDKEHKFILCSDGTEELYHIKSDPWEWHNLAGKSDMRKKALCMKEALLKWRFACIDNVETRKNNYIQHILDGKTELLPHSLGGPKDKY